jgi:hypothetical protein
MANMSGWVLLRPMAFEAQWDGSTKPTAITAQDTPRFRSAMPLETLRQIWEERYFDGRPPEGCGPRLEGHVRKRRLTQPRKD